MTDRAGSSATWGGGRGHPMLLGVLLGLVMGVGLAAGVAVYISKMPSPFQARSGTPATGADGRPVVSDPLNPPPPPGAAAAGQIVPATGDAAAANDGRSQPGVKDSPAPPLIAGTAPAATGSNSGWKSDDNAPRRAGDGAQYYVQAGAFQSQSDAENQKARLALLGLDAQVKAGETPGSSKLLKVRVGPYDSADEAAEVVESLKVSGIASTVVKTPGAPAAANN